MMYNWKFLAVLACIAGLILYTGAAHAQEMPEGLQKIIEYNDRSALDFALKVSFFIAFLAGVTSILSPCILPILPAYFAITFREKKKITVATLIFFLGFTSIFVAMGLAATMTANSLNMLFGNMTWIVSLAGLLLILLGLTMFLGMSFSGFLVNRKFGSDPLGILASGGAFAIGWTACTGPILSGILLMASVMKNYATSSYLMFSYSAGIFVPLFVLSFFYDKSRISKMSGLYRETVINIYGRRYYTNKLNMVAGSLFAVMGATFVVFRGTSVFNGIELFGLKDYFYSLQRMFLENPEYFNTAGTVAFAAFLVMLIYFLKKGLEKD